jgi:glycerol-3-phosphate dehydrogenase
MENSMSREETLQSLSENPNVSVLIVGGGINGIGTFRELALQGVDVLLIDRADFCAGASAASSHMLHGGIRYLENAEFRLVREALIERNRLLKNAPHYAKPLPTTIPMFKRFSGLLNAPLKFLNLLNRPSERGLVVIKFGLMMYDWFTRSMRMTPTHVVAGKEDALKQRPQLNPNIIAAATYYDAWMPYPERLCVELVLDAEAAAPQAKALNYVSLAGAAGDVVRLRDEHSGETLEIKPKVVINAAGPWIDFANRALQQDTKFIGGTKGSHLVVDHPELWGACADSQMFFETKDGRICLIFPFMEGKVIIGTTDIHVDNPDDAQTTDDEIEYILGLVEQVFPNIKIDASHIVFTFCGVRPLPHSDAATAGQISRDHSIRTVEPDDDIHFPVHSLVGGKWTTFRAFSEQTADKALKDLSIPRKVGTQDMSIGGGKDYPTESTTWLESLRQKTELPLERLQTLFERYGTRATDIAEYCVAGADEPLQNKSDYTRREIQYIVNHEKVIHLDDYILRRSSLGMLGYVNGALLNELAAIIGHKLEWTTAEVAAEIQRAAQILQREHGVSPNTLKLSTGEKS